jgi:hypothetical protein
MRVSIRTGVAIAALTLLLAACQSAPPPKLTAPVALNDIGRKLVGAWALNARECSSDNGLVYKADGTWFAYAAHGTWIVVGDKLINLVTHRGEGLGEVKPVVPPERDDVTIVALTDTRFESRWAKGDRRVLVRCPSAP